MFGHSTFEQTQNIFHNFLYVLCNHKDFSINLPLVSSKQLNRFILPNFFVCGRSPMKQIILNTIHSFLCCCSHVKEHGIILRTSWVIEYNRSIVKQGESIVSVWTMMKLASTFHITNLLVWISVPVPNGSYDQVCQVLGFSFWVEDLDTTFVCFLPGNTQCIRSEEVIWGRPWTVWPVLLFHFHFSPTKLPRSKVLSKHLFPTRVNTSNFRPFHILLSW